VEGGSEPRRRWGWAGLRGEEDVHVFERYNDEQKRNCHAGLAWIERVSLDRPNEQLTTFNHVHQENLLLYPVVVVISFGFASD
jgi:hypothetical protein